MIKTWCGWQVQTQLLYEEINAAENDVQLSHGRHVIHAQSRDHCCSQ